MVNWLTKLTVRMLFGVRVDTPKPGIDRHQTFKLSAAEAVNGIEKTVTVKNSRQTKKLVVKVPAGVKTGTNIRLRGMGKNGGDLYLDVKVKE
jgi:DnaJ-class molecular chaperone